MFLCTRISYFGQIVDYIRVSPDQDKIKVVSKFSTPKYANEVWSFVYSPDPTGVL